MGSPSPAAVHRFLDELPDDVLKWLTPKRAHIASQSWNNVDTGDWGSGSRKVYAGKSTPRPYDVGRGVEHAKFGKGVVIAYEGEGDEQRIQINFGKQGMKWLMLSLAKLASI